MPWALNVLWLNLSFLLCELVFYVIVILIKLFEDEYS